MKQYAVRGALATTLALALAACGGGSGGGGGSAGSFNGSASAASGSANLSDVGSYPAKPDTPPSTDSGSGSGSTGSTGSTGSSGSTGGTGSTGSTGSTGGTGSTGSTGGTGTTTGGTGSTGGTGTSTGGTGTTTGGPAPYVATGPKTLVLYDAPAGDEYEKLGFSYAIMLRNLLGHFDAQVDLVPVHQYKAGQIEAHQATFYLGAAYDTPLPAAFLSEAANTSKTLVWFKYNLWQLADNATYRFTQTRGLSFKDLRGMNATPTPTASAPGFFDTVRYKGKDFVKYYQYNTPTNTINADPEIGQVAIADATKASMVVPIVNAKTGEQVPYIAKAGRFWYVADMPFSFIGPRDRYLVLADLLHDIMGIDHPESHKAMVRLEDVGAQVSVNAMKRLTDYLQGKNIRFSIAVIPHHVDPLGSGNNGVPQEIPLANATNLRTALDYALPRGAEIVMHGYTHQYAAMKNPWTGMSGDDYEFWDIVHNAPVPEDSTSWVTGRLAAGLMELTRFNYGPVAWETPHYQASATASRAFPLAFNTTYQRVVYYTADKPDFSSHPGKDFSAGQIFPYVITRDYYGQRILPENLGNIEYDISKLDPTSFFVYTWQDIYINAQYALTVRDGFASFFFHPFWLEKEIGQAGYSDFTKLVDGITQLGFTWVTPSMIP